MAVRNIQAIQRHGDMIAQQERNKREAKELDFWTKVDTIKKCHEDAVDAIDTIKALFANGLRKEFETWLESQNVGYSDQFERFSVSCPNMGKGEHAYVSYVPGRDSVRFAWNGYGMCEEYDTAQYSMSHFIHNYLDKRYAEGLHRLSIRLQPFLDAFFKWTETL